MQRTLARCLAAILALATSTVFAEFHLLTIDEIYSNADGNVQFVVLTCGAGCVNGENFLAGHALTATGGKSFMFPTDLPSSSTAGRKVLIATQGFAALGLVTPDYTISNGFIPLSGTVNYAGVDQLTYASLPTDGTNALYRDGSRRQNLATNFAGASASVTVTAPPPAAALDLNQHGLTGPWYEPATDGQGFEIEVFPDMIAPGTGFVSLSWFTFDTVAGGAERQRWYTLSGNVVSGQPSASLTIYRNIGGNFNALPITNADPVGTATLRFDTCSSGQLSYSFTDGSGRSGTIPLTRITQNVTCSTTSARPTNADFSFSGNWYNAATSGQGFVAEVNPNNGSIFVPWYTYAPSGAGAGPAGQRWYTAQGSFTPGSRSIPVQLFETTGGVFDLLPAPQRVQVGSATIAFQSCSTATFSYTFSGGSSSGMSGLIALTRIGPVPPGCVF